MKVGSNKYYRMPFIIGPLFDRENSPRIAYPQVESVALQYQTDAMPTLIPKPDDKS